MKFIIFDLEWNQPVTHEEKVDSMPHGEVIQIGFIVCEDDLHISHKEELVIRPVCYPVMHKYVSALTGITQADIDKGIPFSDAIGRMAEFFDDETVIITWGDDDMPLLNNNLKYHSITDIVFPKHYNLQRIFGVQTGTRSRQTGLKTAADCLGIEADIKAHDALNDAFMTYLIAVKLDLKKGIEDYNNIVIKPSEKSSQQPWNFEKALYTYSIPFEGSLDALAAICRKIPIHCSDCDETLTADIVRQGKMTFIAVCECEKHGKFFLRYELKNKVLSMNCFRSNEDFERIYQNRLRQREKKRLYRDNFRKGAKNGA